MLELFILLTIIFIGSILIKRLSNAIKDRTNIDKNSYSIKPLMTKYERYFYDILIEFEKEFDVKIHPQVNLATILYKENNNRFISELFRNIDFAIFSKDYEELILLIEINDKSHNTKKRRARDVKVDEILNSANVKLIKFYSKYPNKKEYVKQRIKDEIFKIKSSN